MWLPPSEGKTAPVTGPTLDLSTLIFPELSDVRSQVISHVEHLGNTQEAAQILGVGARGREEALEANARLMDSPCGPARQVFSGVLFEAANLGDIPAEILSERVRIFSGLFGVVAPGDYIPNYRLAMGVKLPGVGAMTQLWRPYLEQALKAEVTDRIILDCRSGPYRQACPTAGGHCVELSVVREINGQRQTISHDAKKWRGLVVHSLLRHEGGAQASDPNDIAQTITDVLDTISFIDAKGAPHGAHSVELGATKKVGGGLRTIATLVTT